MRITDESIERRRLKRQLPAPRPRKLRIRKNKAKINLKDQIFDINVFDPWEMIMSQDESDEINADLEVESGLIGNFNDDFPLMEEI